MKLNSPWTAVVLVCLFVLAVSSCWWTDESAAPAPQGSNVPPASSGADASWRPSQTVSSERSAAPEFVDGNENADLAVQAAPPAVAVPVALVEPNPDFGWTEKQLAELARLREEFIAALGGTDQDAASPEYARRWQTATAESDEQFRTVLGWEAFRQQQLLPAQ